MKEIIITSSVLILCIMQIRILFKGRISSRFQYALWILVAFRLIIPVTAQISLPIGDATQFRVMDLVNDIEHSMGISFSQLGKPVTLQLSHSGEGDSFYAGMAEGEQTPVVGGADGPTSVFFVQRLGFSWLDVLRWIWFGGMFVMAVWMIATNLLFRYCLYKDRVEYVLSEEIEAVLRERLPETMVRKSQRIRKYLVERLASPCLYGLPGREAIYLTQDITEDADKLCHVLTHELCHRKHGDSFWSLLRCILVVVYWFHPLVWVAAVLSKKDCEFACDEAALMLLGEEERISYGETLLSIITRRGKLSDFSCTATTMTGSAKSVKERISFIVKKPKELGIAVAAVLALVLVILVLVFTKNPRFSGGIWTRGTLTTTTADMQITFPESLAGICGIATEGGNDDLIVYQVASGQEAGRFRRVAFAEAIALVDEGREVVPLGNYGLNRDLMSYMGLPVSDRTIHNYKSIQESITEHIYIPAEDSVTEYHYTPSEGVPGTDSNAGTVPGTDSNDAGSVAPIPSPEESDHDAIHLPYAEGQSIAAQDIAEEQKAKAEEQKENDISDEDAERVYLPNEEITERVYLPNEEITNMDLSGCCYIYVKADYSGVKDKYLEEMEFINEELSSLAGVIVNTVNRNITEEMLEALAKNKTMYLGDNSAVGALIYALPEPGGLANRGYVLETEEGSDYSLQINYDLMIDNVAAVDSDIIFFDAVMLFASIGNVEQCMFTIDSDWIITYYREDMEKIFPNRLNNQGEDEEEFIDHMKMLCTEIVQYLDGRIFIKY